MTTADPGVRPLSPEEQDFLRALARTVVFVPRAFEADLGRAHGLSISEFFALMHLSETPQGRLRMGDLAAATALTLGAVTRVVKLLEGKGLVERRPSASDGRVHEAVITEAGHERLAQAHPAHVAGVRRRILDKLDGLDLRTCTTALSRISQDDSTPRPQGESQP
ncbi:MarR family winged helix-turn-helix transcriptional regulator [Cellulomonas sp. KRMCY2]|uniref:MarR family winged helix-turn-helix transcriptional regulator n=1 Tax=Cellulomonas sp. KRMCY2 TaxID=1304865 RepID=UPI00045E81E8|nr:MarR family transcriptional regulator [Cellulomonas sp. KRMCY2]